KQELSFWAYCVRVKELDQYAVIGVPEEEKLLSVENAKLELVVQVAKYNRENAPESDDDIL
ncbi:hypothetical protein KKJ22_19590, partial [Xenorhabdus bovienii]